jgi:hypothetical protein
MIGMAMDAEPARTLGYIEGRITELAAAVQELLQGLQEVNRRIDRLFLAILGIGGAILAALIVLIIRGL